MNILQAIILAIVEGLTEFIPVSSTGHMIIVSSVMGIASDQFVKMFTVAIQFGAILSVIVLYWRKFIQSFDLYLKLFVAFIPAAVLGKLFSEQIDALLENAVVVAISLFLGGIILLFIDQWLRHDGDDHEDINYPGAFKIGLFQALAMIPGVSRSAATIIGGLTQNLTRKAAAEFSFLLAVPTMFAATVYKMYKFHNEVGFVKEHVSVLLAGNVIAFVVALVAIKGFISYLTKHGFRAFGWYRIILGGVILILSMLGVKLEVL